MPMFSKMMASYPMGLIRGMSGQSKMIAGRAALGAGVGAAVGGVSDRRGMTRGAIAGGVAGAISGGMSAYGGGASTFARNMSRGGVRGMYGRAGMNAGKTAFNNAASRIRRAM